MEKTSKGTMVMAMKRARTAHLEGCSTPRGGASRLTVPSSVCSRRILAFVQQRTKRPIFPKSITLIPQQWPISPSIKLVPRTISLLCPTPAPSPPARRVRRPSPGMVGLSSVIHSFLYMRLCRIPCPLRPLLPVKRHEPLIPRSTAGNLQRWL
jgi:hypothetical protein